MNNTVKLVISFFIIYIFCNNISLKNKIETFDNSIVKNVKKIYQDDIKKIKDVTVYAESLYKGIKVGKITTKNIDVKKNINILPTKLIVAFNGTQNDIPENWQLCNGTNGTPDLRGRFILASGNFESSEELSNRVLGDFGGEEKAGLTIENLPAHKHTVNNNGKHSHALNLIKICFHDGRNDNFYSNGTYDAYGDTKNHNTEKAGEHNHVLKEEGQGLKHENMPPFYVLAWIMKIK